MHTLHSQDGGAKGLFAGDLEITLTSGLLLTGNLDVGTLIPPSGLIAGMQPVPSHAASCQICRLPLKW
jgi:hypothetical protein